MLALVRTFVSDPKIVVVDEASLGLAPIIVDRIFETLARSWPPACRCCSSSST
jgi:branched-chain amino acid transport system ATP-binding protein